VPARSCVSWTSASGTRRRGPSAAAERRHRLAARIRQGLDRARPTAAPLPLPPHLQRPPRQPVARAAALPPPRSVAAAAVATVAPMRRWMPAEGPAAGAAWRTTTRRRTRRRAAARRAGSAQPALVVAAAVALPLAAGGERTCLCDARCCEWLRPPHGCWPPCPAVACSTGAMLPAPESEAQRLHASPLAEA
jgi:hypothetical protein